MIKINNITFEKIANESNKQILYLLDGVEYKTENAIKKYFENQSYNVILSENYYWWMHLSLMFWEVIFAKVKGAVSINQDGALFYIDTFEDSFDELYNDTIKLNGCPSDLFSEEFYSRRKDLFVNRFETLENADLITVLEKNYTNYKDVNCRLIGDWNRFSIHELKVAIETIPKQLYLKILERLLINLPENRKGLPDLLIYKEKNYELIEVKSEKDKLSIEQIQWIEYFMFHKINVSLSVINHTESQIQKIQKMFIKKETTIKVTLGYSTSKKYNQVLEIMKKQSSCLIQSDGKNAILTASFQISDDYDKLSELVELMNLSGNWKNQKYEIDGKELQNSNLNSIINCYFEFVESDKEEKFCYSDVYSESINIFGCRNLEAITKEYSYLLYQKYGYMDSEKGVWIIKKDELKLFLDKEMEIVRYCPQFRENSVSKGLKNIPDCINPQVEKNWAFLTIDGKKWYWYKDRFISTYGDETFPGFGSVNGLQKLNSFERNSTLENKNKSNKNVDITGKTDTTFTIKIEQPQTKKSCYIATAIYQNVDADEVIILRNFHDKKLSKYSLGRIFIKFYYQTAPYVAKMISNKAYMLKIGKKILDVLIKIIK